jgi:hypothetical protein
MFKAGDKVYVYRFGIVGLIAHNNKQFLLKAPIEGSGSYTIDGKVLPTDTHPSVITLEEAEKRGFVRKIVRQAKFRVKYRDPITKNELHVTGMYFKNVESFFETNEYFAASEFVSFVDDQLWDCPPPQETIEWEEII